jgi:hypothetical protein
MAREREFSPTLAGGNRRTMRDSSLVGIRPERNHLGRPYDRNQVSHPKKRMAMHRTGTTALLPQSDRPHLVEVRSKHFTHGVPGNHRYDVGFEDVEGTTDFSPSHTESSRSDLNKGPSIRTADSSHRLQIPPGSIRSGRRGVLRCEGLSALPGKEVTGSETLRPGRSGPHGPGNR